MLYCVCVCFAARQTDSDVVGYVAQGGAATGRDISHKLHPDQHWSDAAARQSQHTTDCGRLHGRREAWKVSTVLLLRYVGV